MPDDGSGLPQADNLKTAETPIPQSGEVGLYSDVARLDNTVEGPPPGEADPVSHAPVPPPQSRSWIWAWVAAMAVLLAVGGGIFLFSTLHKADTSKTSDTGPN